MKNKRLRLNSIRSLDQRGSIAVTTVLVLAILVSVMAFTLDTGHLVNQQRRHHHGAEAAALAGAAQLCESDWDQVKAMVRDTARANGLSDQNGTLDVEIGFYDEQDVYPDFERFKAFAGANHIPEGEYANAVLVTYVENDVALTGLNPPADVGSRAVAYLRRLDLASLDPMGDIRLGHDSEWHNTVMWSNNDIKYPEAAAHNGGYFSTPEFEDCLLLCTGQVVECPVDDTKSVAYPKMIIDWHAGGPTTVSGAVTGLDPIKAIQPVDEDYLDYWRNRADVVYTPDMAGKDNVYYDQKDTVSIAKGGPFYYVNPAGAWGGRRVIFFDADADAGGTVMISPVVENTPLPSTGHAPGAITGLTFVATCPIHIANFIHVSSGKNPKQYLLHVGGEYEDQALFISGKDIT
ncbi:MAG: hypothetical protein KJP07_17995, partial [Desulfatitalea sp.]|nr:hypothetical protein [Desulfatitalea sp.]